jgi:hypothetical protein
MRTRAVAAVALFAAATAGARAEEPGGLDDAALEAIVSAVDSTATAVDRSWLYNDPARAPAPGHAVGFMRGTYGGGSPTRPMAGNLATAGALLEIGGEVGLVEGLSLVAIGAQGDNGAGSGQTGAMLGLRWSLLPRTLRRTQLVLSGGVLRELQGSAGAWARASFGHDEGRARFAASLHGERLFATGRDAIDLIVTAGATFRVLETVRAGVEYVGQDLEGTFDQEAEGGPRHLIGPMVSAALFSERLSATAGPALALGAGQSHLLGRVALTYQF